MPAESESLLPGLSDRARAVGLTVRGAMRLAEAGVETLGTRGTLVLLGFTGGREWPAFAGSPEATDGAAHPLDRWSRRVIDGLAREFDARAVYPDDRPAIPFQRLARRAEPVSPSPLGLLIHPEFGLWHAYRGALVLPHEIPSTGTRTDPPSPCTTCTARPCLSACPVGAYADGTLDVRACTTHVNGTQGGTCRTRGCLARNACPVGSDFRYGDAQMRFHMDAFLRACSAGTG